MRKKSEPAVGPKSGGIKENMRRTTMAVSHVIRHKTLAVPSKQGDADASYEPAAQNFKKMEFSLSNLCMHMKVFQNGAFESVKSLVDMALDYESTASAGDEDPDLRQNLLYLQQVVNEIHASAEDMIKREFGEKFIEPLTAELETFKRVKKDMQEREKTVLDFHHYTGKVQQLREAQKPNPEKIQRNQEKLEQTNLKLATETEALINQFAYYDEVRRRIIERDMNEAYTMYWQFYRDMQERLGAYLGEAPPPSDDKFPKPRGFEVSDGPKPFTTATATAIATGGSNSSGELDGGGGGYNGNSNINSNNSSGGGGLGKLGGGGGGDSWSRDTFETNAYPTTSANLYNNNNNNNNNSSMNKHDANNGHVDPFSASASTSTTPPPSSAPPAPQPYQSHQPPPPQQHNPYEQEQDAYPAPAAPDTGFYQSYAPPPLQAQEPPMAAVVEPAAVAVQPPPPPPAAPASLEEEMTVEALFAFLAQREGDLEFQPGDHIRTSKADWKPDGWVTGRSLSSGKTGTFPANYVKAI